MYVQEIFDFPKKSLMWFLPQKYGLLGLGTYLQLKQNFL